MLIMTDQEFEEYLDNVTNGKQIFELGDEDFKSLGEKISSFSPSEAMGGKDLATLFAPFKTDNAQYRKYPPERTSEHRTPPSDMKKIYFYHFDVTDEGEFQAELTVHIRNSQDIDSQIQDIVNSQANTTFESTSNIDEVKWDDYCYLVFFVNNSGWDHIDYEGANFSLHFFAFKDSSGIEYHANRSFFGARELKVSRQADGTRHRKVLVVENHQRYPDGTPREKGAAADNYKFDIYYRVPFKPPLMVGENEKKMTIILDPGGQNTGPPD